MFLKLINHKRNLFALLILLVFIIAGQSLVLSNSQDTKSSKTVVVFSIPISNEGIHYGKDTQTWGPATLNIAPDGTFLIADTVANRILQYDSAGVQIKDIKLDSAVGITDIVTNTSSIFVLDEAALEPTIYNLSFDGTVQDSNTLPTELRNQGMKGIAVREDGELVIKMRDDAPEIRFNNQVPTAQSINEQPFTVQFPDPNDASADRSQGFITKDDNRITIKVDNILGGLSILGSGQKGDFYVLIEELSNTSALTVDQTVRHYTADGNLIDMARVPIAERFTYVKNGVAIAPDGNIYALITRPDRVDIVRLGFKKFLKSILPETDNSVNLFAPYIAQATTCSRTRDEMINTAWAYFNNRTSLTAANINGNCPGRNRPSYLTTPGVYTSVPYDWGGYDSLNDFNSAMAQGLQAGDIPPNVRNPPIHSCAHGVDCSGFVSNCWGTDRYTTENLPTICTPIAMSQAQRGDIILIRNSQIKHVVLIESITSNGVNTLESTIGPYNRVSYLTNSWSRFNTGWTFYRYNNVCDSSGTARPVVSSSLTLSSSSPYYVNQTIQASFTITNRGSQSITMARLLVGGRLNGDQSCAGGCPDFTSVNNITLTPGQSYPYIGSRYLDRIGTYSFFVAYQKTDGSWVTNVDVDSGVSNSRSITVQNNPLPGSFTLTATPECNGSSAQIRLSWTTSSGAQNYDIYRNGSLYTSNFSGTQFINTLVTPGVGYSYFIKANNSVGTTFSNTVSTTASNNCGVRPSASVQISFSPNPVFRSSDGLWRYTVIITEINGIGVNLTSLRVGGYDYSAQIGQWFGTTRIGPRGSIRGSFQTNCSSCALPSNLTWQFIGNDDNQHGGLSWSGNVTLR